ncbi:MAG: 3-hydroxybutyrate dehydrogenase [Microscillaceae bacterium]|nr:3-hydroxybutyrate dehydrogenase [Microscillaceae bacterium]MDW8459672.1 3-hydroxybutyrate dehydrogenase [Cytophagales bacterium]
MKNVIITGSTSGIGLGIAREFAKAGYGITFNGLEKNGEEIAAQIAQEFGVKTIFVAANLLKLEEIKQLAEKTFEAFGKVDVLVNNAGVQFVSPVEDFPEDKWRLIMGVNLDATFFLTQAVWKHMKERKFGRVINITSAHGLRASEFKSAYVASKHAVTGLTKVLALEGAEFGITCNAICPGYVKTPLVEGQIKDQAKAHNMSEEEVIQKVMLKKQAIKEFVSVELLGKLALFLASEEANMITGTSIPVEGGWVVQ